MEARITNYSLTETISVPSPPRKKLKQEHHLMTSEMDHSEQDR